MLSNAEVNAKIKDADVYLLDSKNLLGNILSSDKCTFAHDQVNGCYYCYNVSDLELYVPYLIEHQGNIKKIRISLRVPEQTMLCVKIADSGVECILQSLCSVEYLCEKYWNLP